jgi:shikimate kinase
MKILICGFMGAGKSYWLNELKKNSIGSSFNFIDLDHELAHAMQIEYTKLGEWIRNQGWPAFRQLEEKTIRDLLKAKEDLILSLGGGSLHQDLIDDILINKNIKLVYLDTAFEICSERITSDPNRPLASLPIEELRSLYEERKQLYSQAHLTLSEALRKDIECIQSLVHTLEGPK